MPMIIWLYSHIEIGEFKLKKEYFNQLHGTIDIISPEFLNCLNDLGNIQVIIEFQPGGNL